ncbi:hypothetical protein Pelo_4214 [Pelomyxa schiedti]|nr:hypothetical protein Pelo_4214 [Pelomyxa schiedti]
MPTLAGYQRTIGTVSDGISWAISAPAPKPNPETTCDHIPLHPYPQTVAPTGDTPAHHNHAATNGRVHLDRDNGYVAPADIVATLRVSTDHVRDYTLMHWKRQMTALCCALHPRLGSRSSLVRSILIVPQSPSSSSSATNATATATTSTCTTSSLGRRRSNSADSVFLPSSSTTTTATTTTCTTATSSSSVEEQGQSRDCGTDSVEIMESMYGIGNLAEIVRYVGAWLRPTAAFVGKLGTSWAVFDSKGAVSRVGHVPPSGNGSRVVKALGSMCDRLCVLWEYPVLRVWDTVTGQSFVLARVHPADLALWITKDPTVPGKIVMSTWMDNNSELDVLSFPSCGSLYSTSMRARCGVAWLGPETFVAASLTGLSVYQLPNSGSSASGLCLIYSHSFSNAFTPVANGYSITLSSLPSTSGNTASSAVVMYKKLEWSRGKEDNSVVYLFTRILSAPPPGGPHSEKATGFNAMQLTQNATTFTTRGTQILVQVLRKKQPHIVVFNGESGQRLFSILSPSVIEQMVVFAGSIIGISCGQVLTWDLLMAPQKNNRESKVQATLIDGMCKTSHCTALAIY